MVFATGLCEKNVPPSPPLPMCFNVAQISRYTENFVSTLHLCGGAGVGVTGDIRKERFFRTTRGPKKERFFALAMRNTKKGGDQNTNLWIERADGDLVRVVGRI